MAAGPGREAGSIQGIFSGKLKLVGSMAQIQRNPKATYELAKVAGQIDTDFGS